MCCQFYFDHDTLRDIRRIVDAVDSGMEIYQFPHNRQAITFI